MNKTYEKVGKIYKKRTWSFYCTDRAELVDPFGEVLRHATGYFKCKQTGEIRLFKMSGGIKFIEG